MRAPDEAFWREQFHRSGQESFSWFLKALELKRAADELAPIALDDLARMFKTDEAGESPLARRPVIGPYLLLAGLAVETLAKAILIDRDPTRVHDGVMERWPGGAHPIGDVCQRIGVPWTAEERELFERLSDEVTWVGRYPIPMKERDLFRRASRVGGIGSNMKPADPSLIEQVWSTLHTVLDEEWLAARPERAADYRARLVTEALRQREPSGHTRYDRGVTTIVIGTSTTADDASPPPSTARWA